jgi:hypothetical protein
MSKRQIWEQGGKVESKNLKNSPEVGSEGAKFTGEVQDHDVVGDRGPNKGNPVGKPVIGYPLPHLQIHDESSKAAAADLQPWANGLFGRLTRYIARARGVSNDPVTEKTQSEDTSTRKAGRDPSVAIPDASKGSTDGLRGSTDAARRSDAAAIAVIPQTVSALDTLKAWQRMSGNMSQPESIFRLPPDSSVAEVSREAQRAARESGKALVLGYDGAYDGKKATFWRTFEPTGGSRITAVDLPDGRTVREIGGPRQSINNVGAKYNVYNYVAEGSQAPVQFSGAISETPDHSFRLAQEFPNAGPINQAVRYIDPRNNKVLVDKDGRVPTIPMPENQDLLRATSPIVTKYGQMPPDIQGGLTPVDVRQTAKGFLATYDAVLTTEAAQKIEAGGGKFVDASEVKETPAVPWSPAPEAKAGLYLNETIPVPRTGTVWDIYDDGHRLRVIAQVRGKGDLHALESNKVGTTGGYANGQEDPLGLVKREREEELENTLGMPKQEMAKQEGADASGMPKIMAKLSDAPTFVTHAARVENNANGNPFDVAAIAFPAVTSEEVEKIKATARNNEVKEIVTPTPFEVIKLAEESEFEGNKKTAFNHVEILKVAVLDPRFKEKFKDDRRDLLNYSLDQAPEFNKRMREVLSSPPSPGRDEEVIKVVKAMAKNDRSIDTLGKDPDAVGENAKRIAEVTAERKALAKDLKAAGYESSEGVLNYGGREQRIIDKQLGDPYRFYLSSAIGRTDVIGQAARSLENGEGAGTKINNLVLDKYEKLRAIENQIGPRTDNIGVPISQVDTADRAIKFSGLDESAMSAAQAQEYWKGVEKNASNLASQYRFPLEVTRSLANGDKEVHVFVPAGRSAIEAVKTQATLEDGRLATNYAISDDVPSAQAARAVLAQKFDPQSADDRAMGKKPSEVVTFNIGGKVLNTSQLAEMVNAEGARLDGLVKAGGGKIPADMEVRPGEDIRSAAERASLMAKQLSRPVAFDYNDISVTAQPEDTTAMVQGKYAAAYKDWLEAHRQTPEAAAERAISQRDIAEKQENIDRLVKELPGVSGDRAMVNWVQRFAQLADNHGLKYDSQAVAKMMIEKGYQPVSKGLDPVTQADAHAYAQWGVGRAVADLQAGALIRPVVERFAREYEAKFGATNADAGAAKVRESDGIFAGIEAAGIEQSITNVKPEGDKIGRYSDRQIEALFDQAPKLQMAKGYYEVKAEKVDSTKYKDGIVASSTDSRMRLESPMTIMALDGTTVTLPIGTEFPSGFELKPGSIQETSDLLRTISDVDLAVKNETGRMNIRLPDGKMIEVGNQHINGNVSVTGGAKVPRDGYTIDRDAVDANGQKIVDAYFNKNDADFNKRWKEVPGKKGVFSPTESQMGEARVLVQIPVDWEPGTMQPIYGGYRDSDVQLKPGDFVILTRGADGKVDTMYRVEEAAAVGTYVGVDAAGKEALAGSAERMRDFGGHVVAAAHSEKEYYAREATAAAPVLSAGVHDSLSTEERALARISEKGYSLTEQQRKDLHSAIEVLLKADPEQRRELLEQARRAAEEAQRSGARRLKDARGLTAAAYLGPDVINAIAAAFGI